MMKKLLFAALAICTLPAHAQDITLRHGLAGHPLDALATLVVRFNGDQKGKGKIILQDVKGIAGTPGAPAAPLPHLALLDPIDDQRFFGTSPRFVPLFQIMATAKSKFGTKDFFPQMAGAVEDLKGRIQALPLAHALPVLFYNRDAFVRAGLDPDNPPKTWWEVQTAAGKLFDAGFKCPLTSSDFAWVHVDNMASQHSEPALTRDGKVDKVTLNTMVHVKHLALLASWQKSFYFHYFGPGNEGDAKFMSGECSMLTGESPFYAELKRSGGFRFGMAELPHYDDVRGARPANILPDGMGLWALPGMNKDEQVVVAHFVEFLMKPEIQREWVAATAFLPMTPAAIDALKAAGGPAPLLEKVAARLSTLPLAAERTRHDGGRSRIRGILNQEIEFVWGNKKPAKEALDTAMQRANAEVQIPAEATPAVSPVARKKK